MAFDPDAYLAQKAKPAASSGGAFNPDTYLASKSPVSDTQQPQRSAAGGFGLGARDVLTGAGNILQAPFEAVGGFAKGAAEMAGYPKAGAAINKAVVPGNVGEMASNAMGLPKPRTSGEQTQSDIQRGVVGVAAPFMNMGGVNAVRAVPSIAKGAAKWGSEQVGRLGGAIDRGYGVPQAQQGALAAGRELATEQAGRLGGEASSGMAAGQKAAATHLSEAKSYDDLSARLSRDIAESAKSGNVPSPSKQGETVRGAIEGAYNATAETRSSVTEPLYKKAESKALEYERDGARIDVSKVTPHLDKLINETKHLEGLNNKLVTLRDSVTGTEPKPPVAAPIGSGKVTSRLTPTKTALPDKPGLTYSELGKTSRYLKNVGYSGEMEGYDAITRRAALDLAGKLDKEIATFVPEHAEASAKYRDLSEGLSTLKTRIGKAVTGSEGGIKGDEWSKIANEDLPARLFGKREGVEQVVHALAGGDSATPAQLATAQKQVDQMVEHWLMSDVRGTATAPRTGTAALDVLGKRSGTLEAVPEVGARIKGQLGREATKEQSMADLAKSSAESRTLAKTATGDAGKAAKPLQAEQARVSDMVKTADELLKAGNEKEALAKYTSAIRGGLANDQPKYQAALAWLNRAETTKLKAERAKKLAPWLAGFVGLGGAAKLGIKVPGV